MKNLLFLHGDKAGCYNTRRWASPLHSTGQGSAVIGEGKGGWQGERMVCKTAAGVSVAVFNV